jgi:hypothetical protein
MDEKKMFSHVRLVYIEALPGGIRMARDAAGEFSLHHDLSGRVEVRVTQDVSGRFALSGLVGSKVVFDLDLDPSTARQLGNTLSPR